MTDRFIDWLNDLVVNRFMVIQLPSFYLLFIPQSILIPDLKETKGSDC